MPRTAAVLKVNKMSICSSVELSDKSFTGPLDVVFRIQSAKKILQDIVCRVQSPFETFPVWSSR
jgi:hypothetical protein